MNAASATSVLYFLFSQHEDSASQYRQIADRLDDDTLSAYMRELAQFHGNQSKAVRRVLDDMSPSPMPMPDSAQKKSLLNRNQSEVWDTIEQKEYQQLLEFSSDNEGAVSESYKEGLDNDALPEGIHKMVQELHQNVLKTVRQTERYKTVQDIQLGNIPTA